MRERPANEWRQETWKREQQRVLQWERERAVRECEKEWECVSLYFPVSCCCQARPVTPRLRIFMWDYLRWHRDRDRRDREGDIDAAPGQMPAAGCPRPACFMPVLCLFLLSSLQSGFYRLLPICLPLPTTNTCQDKVCLLPPHYHMSSIYHCPTCFRNTTTVTTNYQLLPTINK